MSAPIRAAHARDTRWPMTRRAWQQAVDACAQLRGDVSTLAGQGLEEGIVRLPVALAARRLETLTQVVDAADIVEDVRRAAIGRRTVLRDESGETMTYEIVCPGEGDAARGLISADSPLGGSLLGVMAGDVVEVDAPSGRWRATVLDVA